MRMGFWGMNNNKALIPSSSSSSSSSSAIIIITTTLVLCFIVRVSSNETSSAALTLGYEQVATVRLGRISKSWSAPCFAQNAARLELSIISGTSIGSVYIMPHNGKCWSCRDDYQIRLGDEIMSTGSVYFGAVEAPFLFAYMTTDQRERIQKEGMKIFVDKNAACNGVSRKIMKNPFLDMEFVAMN
ncbi:unnamed protein product [Cuscuta campestris]|uniref:Uncharacterized protein n=1 Tax=Cuscuta campestris TaxID=132261 RepID=A0A484NHV5_9ASTE|nr:unnamed protein product [Cuscuta campestris]